jgi:hypothetical protein
MSVPAAAPRARSVGGFRGETTTWAVAATLLVAGLACLASPNFHAGFDPARGPLGGDFLQEWIGGYLVRSGQAARLYDGPYVRALEHDAGLVGFDWSGQRYLPMVYPPFYYALVSPLSLLPLGAAGVVWAALMILFLAATQVLLARGLEGPGGRSAWLWPCAILFAPLVQNLTSGQKGTVLLLLFAATYVLFRRGRPFWAGVVFGLLAFKPQLTLVIGAAMLAKGRIALVVRLLPSAARGRLRCGDPRCRRGRRRGHAGGGCVAAVGSSGDLLRPVRGAVFGLDDRHVAGEPPLVHLRPDGARAAGNARRPGARAASLVGRSVGAADCAGDRGSAGGERRFHAPGPPGWDPGKRGGDVRHGGLAGGCPRQAEPCYIVFLRADSTMAVEQRVARAT